MIGRICEDVFIYLASSAPQCHRELPAMMITKSARMRLFGFSSIVLRKFSDPAGVLQTSSDGNILSVTSDGLCGGV